MPPKRLSSKNGGGSGSKASLSGRPPPPNPSHPCYPLAVGKALSKDKREPSHAHSLDYHWFINSKGNPCRDRAIRGPNPLIETHVLQQKLLAWFDQVKETRGMPWRKEVDLDLLSKEEKSQRGYEVWVSEIMLQQTQVSTVLSYFPRWIARFPTLSSLASCTDVEIVNSLWKGLGYYSRASRLWAGSKTVVRDHHGFMPENVSELETIEGIGPYSAGAISSIAFAQRVPLVDGNVTRVLSRLTALHANGAAKTTNQFLWSLASTLVPPSTYETRSPGGSHGGKNKPGAWNQALMELGATICSPKNPNCGECPLQDECLAWNEVRVLAHPSTLAIHLRDIEEYTSSPTPQVSCELCVPFSPLAQQEEPHTVMRYPMSKEKKKVREEETAVCVLEWEDTSKPKSNRKVLMIKRPEKGLLAGLFDFPAIDLSSNDEPSSFSDRATQLNNLLKALVPDMKFDPINLVAPNSKEKDNGIPADCAPNTTSLKVVRMSDWGSVLQVYSHQKRNYHIVSLIISSPSLPTLASVTSEPLPTHQQVIKYSKAKRRKVEMKEQDFVVEKSEHYEKGSFVMVENLGRAKWVGEEDVAKENTGGAMGKIWLVRQNGGQAPIAPLNGKKKTDNNYSRHNNNKKAASVSTKLTRLPSKEDRNDPKQTVLSFSTKQSNIGPDSEKSPLKPSSSLAISPSELEHKMIEQHFTEGQHIAELIEEQRKPALAKAYAGKRKRVILCSDSEAEDICFIRQEEQK